MTLVKTIKKSTVVISITLIINSHHHSHYHLRYYLLRSPKGIHSAPEMIESTGSHHRRSCNAERLITWILDSRKNFYLPLKLLWVCFKTEIEMESTFQIQKIHLINVCRYEKVVVCQVLINSPTFYLDQSHLKQSLISMVIYIKNYCFLTTTIYLVQTQSCL